MFANMAWIEPQYSSKDVDKAGAVFLRRLGDTQAEFDDFMHALDVIDNWRGSHAFPLNTFQVTLRRKARSVYDEALVAQRIKRLASIGEKLLRLRDLSLSQMQDIGGCRAVVGTLAQVNRLVKVYETSDLRHTPLRKDDYILKPKWDGYRGIHLIYQYHSRRKQTWDGLQVEMQFRTNLQHTWATAVETVQTFTAQALKAHRGSKDWHRFFALMGTHIALREHAPPVPHTPTSDKEIARELRQLSQKLNVAPSLNAYASTIDVIQKPVVRNADRFLLVLDPQETVTITSYRFGELERASKDYTDAENRIRQHAGAQAVLVSVDSINTLRRAYPNYFADTRAFLGEVKRALVAQHGREAGPGQRVVRHDQHTQVARAGTCVGFLNGAPPPSSITKGCGEAVQLRKPSQFLKQGSKSRQNMAHFSLTLASRYQ
ncbi:MAG: RelA/SpoT domain-containing protein [Chloroflexota bacterium]|nr:RelA/SpoT domain-containing protein [Chloroflexota bacterium]